MTAADGKYGEEPAAGPGAVREYWNRHVDDWKIAVHPPGSREFFEEIEAYRFEKLHYLARLVDFSAWPGKRLLEVGCGVGNDLSRFARGGAVVTGVDIAPRAIELARLNFRQRSLSGEFFEMDGETMEFPDESFDVVYCHTVLHFTPSPRAMIAEIRRVLRPGGTAILMMVNRRSWMNILRKLMRVEVDHLDAPVYHRVTIAEFSGLLDGFATRKIVPERFPVATRVHKGVKAGLYNGVFVAGFNALPHAWTRNTGHHLVAFCTR